MTLVRWKKKKEKKPEKKQESKKNEKHFFVEPTDEHHARTRKVMQSGWGFWGRAGGRLWGRAGGWLWGQGWGQVILVWTSHYSFVPSVVRSSSLWEQMNACVVNTSTRRFVKSGKTDLMESCFFILQKRTLWKVGFLSMRKGTLCMLFSHKDRGPYAVMFVVFLRREWGPDAILMFYFGTQRGL